jgi:hypothetical protein
MQHLQLTYYKTKETVVKLPRLFVAHGVSSLSRGKTQLCTVHQLKEFSPKANLIIVRKRNGMRALFMRDT